MSASSTIIVIAAGLIQATSGPASRPGGDSAMVFGLAVAAANDLVGKGATADEATKSGVLARDLALVIEPDTFKRDERDHVWVLATLRIGEQSAARYQFPREREAMRRLEEAYGERLGQIGRPPTTPREQARQVKAVSEWHDPVQKGFRDAALARKDWYELVELRVDLGQIAPAEMPALVKLKKLRLTVRTTEIFLKDDKTFAVLGWYPERGMSSGGLESLGLPRRIGAVDAKLIRWTDGGDPARSRTIPDRPAPS